MIGRWQALSNTMDVLFAGNYPDYYVQGRNRTFTRPTTPRTSGPARYVYYDFSVDENSVTTRGRTREIRGHLGGLTFVQGNGGDVTLDFLDRLESIADAWAETGEAARLYFFGVVPQEMVYSGSADSPQWSLREWSLPFRYVSPVSPEGEGILGGISSSTTQVSAPALSLLDFVGVQAGSWRRVKAAEDEPSCLGMVSAALEGDLRLVALSGFVRILAGHGFTPGPLYLSQVTPGAATSAAADSGVSRRVAEVLNSTDLIIVSSDEVVL